MPVLLQLLMLDFTNPSPSSSGKLPSRSNSELAFTTAGLLSNSVHPHSKADNHNSDLGDPVARIGGWIENHWLFLLICYVAAFAGAKGFCNYTSVIPIWGKIDMACLCAPWVFWIPWIVWLLSTKLPEAETIRISAYVMLPPIIISMILSFIANGTRLHYALISIIMKAILFPLIPFVATLAFRGLTIGTEDGRYKDGTKNNMTSSVMQGLSPVFDFFLGDFIRSRADND